jgi:hypothetical protein
MRPIALFLLSACVMFSLFSLVQGCGMKGEPQQEKLHVGESDQQPPAPEQQKVNPQGKPEYTVKVTPVDFFLGELKRLEAHHDFTSAVCFKIKIEGNVRCAPDVELWREGNRIDLPKYGFIIDDHSDEISFSVRTLPPSKEDKVLYRVSVGGMWSFARYLEKPIFREPLEVAFGPVSLEKPIELLPDSDSAVVWAMGGGHGIGLWKSQEEVEKRLKTLPWAMILRLRAEKKGKD